jgi:hypothetical protein
MTTETLSTDALARIIAQQQAEIDGLRSMVAGHEQSRKTLFERDKELFENINALLDFKVQNYWKDNQAKALDQYRELRHTLRMHLIESGWCINCTDFRNQCGCDDE